MTVPFIFLRRMPFLAPILDYTDPLFALVMTPGFYLNYIEVADQDTTRGSL